MDEDLDRAHEAIVAGVADGTIPLEDRESTMDEAHEAQGDLTLLATDNWAMDNKTNDA